MTQRNRWTRCLVLIFVPTTLAVSIAGAVGETTFPYVAYVASQQTFARSGPGQHYYPTSPLPRGHAVEVYRHEGDGWCAVRPPEGSFCWVAAHEIRRLGINEAEVAVDATIARVGSSLSPARSAVQVMLHRGEKLQLLPAGPNNDPRWLRIAPPAGEFRWISSRGLSRTPPVESASGVEIATNWTRVRAPSEIQPVAGESPSDAFSHLLSSTPSNELAQGVPEIAEPLPTTAEDPNEVQVVPGSPAAVETGLSGAMVPPTLLSGVALAPANISIEPRTSSTPRVRFGNSPSVVRAGTDRVQELQLRLSQTVVRPKEEWQFSQLQAEAAAMLEKSDSSVERDQLRDLLERIARFQDIQLGATRGTGTMVADAGPNTSNSNFTGRTDEVRNLAAGDLSGNDPFVTSKPVDHNEPRYDAVGRLKPVVSQADGAPRFALVDDKGGVVSFVTPTPDLNLRPYVGMRIGVNGSRGFMPEYRKAHVTAGRVTPIEDRIRR